MTEPTFDDVVAQALQRWDTIVASGPRVPDLLNINAAKFATRVNRELADVRRAEGRIACTLKLLLRNLIADRLLQLGAGGRLNVAAEAQYVTAVVDHLHNRIASGDNSWVHALLVVSSDKGQWVNPRIQPNFDATRIADLTAVLPVGRLTAAMLLKVYVAPLKFD